MRPNNAGRIAYERDVELRPKYHDGTPRKKWEELGEVEQWSWGRGTWADSLVENLNAKVKDDGSSC
jgi:hypothetical protein